MSLSEVSKFVVGKQPVTKNSLISALRVPEVGEERRRQQNLNGPDFRIQFKFVIASILVLLVYFIIAHPSFWHFIFQSIGYRNKPEL